MYKKILIVLCCFIPYVLLRFLWGIGALDSVGFTFHFSEESMEYNLGYSIGYDCLEFSYFNMGLFFIIFIISIILTLTHKKLWYKKMRNTIFIIIGIEFLLGLLYYYIATNKFVSMHSSAFITSEIKGIMREGILIPILIDGLVFWKFLHILKPKNMN